MAASALLRPNADDSSCGKSENEWQVALSGLTCFLEQWGSQQQSILQEALDKIVNHKLTQVRYPDLQTSAMVSESDSIATTPPNDTLSYTSDSRKESDELHLSGARQAIASNRSLRSTMWTKTRTSSQEFPRCLLRIVDRACAVRDQLIAQSNPPHGWLPGAIQSKTFEIVTMAVILAHAVYLAFSTNYDASCALNGIQSYSALYFSFDIAFTVFYVFELIGRIYVFRFHFIFGDNVGWNLMDVCLICLALQDSILTHVFTSVGSNTSNFAFVRLARILKLFKSLKLIRVIRTFKALRLIVNSILGAMQAMLWSFSLILVVMFAFGICLTEACSIYFQESPDVDLHHREMLIHYWGSVSTSMMSLYMAVFGGENWREMADSLTVVGEGIRLTFFAFVACFNLIILNTLTSLFVESTMHFACKDAETLIRNEMDKKRHYVDLLRKLFSRMDTNKNGRIEFDELTASFDRREMIAFMSSLKIDVYDVIEFVNQLSDQGQVDIDLDQFVTQCMKLRGAARSVDLIACASAQQLAMMRVSKQLSSLSSQVGLLGKRSQPRMRCSL